MIWRVVGRNAISCQSTEAHHSAQCDVGEGGGGENGEIVKCVVEGERTDKMFAECVWCHTAVSIKMAKRRSFKPLQFNEARRVRLYMASDAFNYQKRGPEIRIFWLGWFRVSLLVKRSSAPNLT